MRTPRRGARCGDGLGAAALWVGLAAGVLCGSVACGGGGGCPAPCADDADAGDAGAPMDADGPAADGAVDPARCLDTTPPPVPAAPTLSLADDGSVRVDWATVSDPSGVRYEVLRDDLPVSEVDAPPYFDAAPRQPSNSYVYRVVAVDGAGNRSIPGRGAVHVEPPAEAGLDDGVDDDGDGWLETSFGFRLRASHPRAAVDPETLAQALARMTGPEAEEPYASWFAEMLGRTRSPLESALAYLATGEPGYLDEVVAAIGSLRPGIQGGTAFRTMMAVDLLFDALPPAALQQIRQTFAGNLDAFGYGVPRFVPNVLADPRARMMGSPHGAPAFRSALLYAAIFAFTDADADPGVADPFPSVDLLRAMHANASPDGWYHLFEGHISGDLALFPDRLQGRLGGMHDNLGYDSAEESSSLWLWYHWWVATGQPRYRAAYHDRYRGEFWYAMRIPHTERPGRSGPLPGVCDDPPLVSDHVRIWTPTATAYTSPNAETRALLGRLYGDPFAQLYAVREACDGIAAMDALFFDPSVAPLRPTEAPLTGYFPGPGLVLSRSTHDVGSPLAVLIAGRGYGRRYEDAASFIVHRRGPVVVHASKRARTGAHSDASFWFHIHGASKNALRIYDPEERRCGDPEAPRLVASDALGGPVFERGRYSDTDGVFDPSGTPGCAEESADEHVPALPSAEVRAYEARDGEVYARVDATYPFRAKVESFERSMVHAGDFVLLFDRVVPLRSEARVVWAAHFAADPVLETSPRDGYAPLGDATVVRFEGADVVDVYPLFPEAREVGVRGGVTTYFEGALASGAGAAVDRTLTSPRWLVVRGDAAGDVRVRGEGPTGAIDEVVSVAQAVRDERGGFAGATEASFTRIDRIEALDGFGALTVEVPHRYDTPDIDGRVHSFEPGRAGGEARPDGREFGRHTLEIEEREGGDARVFLVGLSMADAGVEPAPLTTLRGEGFVGAVAGERAWIFATSRPLDSANVSLPAGVRRVAIFGVEPSRTYAVTFLGEELRFEPSAAPTHCASDQGVLRVVR